MKKVLLLAAVAAFALPAMAESEGVSYEAKDGYTFENVWMNCQAKGEWSSLVGTALPSADYNATGVALGDKAYTVCSKSFVTNEDGTQGLGDNGLILEFDYATGKYLGSKQLTVDGAPLYGLLCAHNIDVDDFGNLYLSGYLADTWDDANNVAKPLKIYTVDPATGVCTLAASPALTEDDRSCKGRVDYIDVVGDITRQQAGCVIVAAPSAPADLKYVYCWKYDQGSDEFYGGLAGDSYIALEIEDSYPVIEGPWGGCQSIFILPDDEFTGSLYYIDAFNSLPALYDNEGGMIASFADVTDETLVPTQGCNGAYEFVLGDDTFFMYPFEQSNAEGPGARARLTRYGSAGDMTTLSHMYDFPSIGMSNNNGANNHGGRRLHCLQSRIVTDAAGKQAAEILSFVCGRGFALFRLAQEGFNSGVNDLIVEDSNAPVEYFNLQGVSVANPENGIFIRRQGSNVKKVVL